MITENQISRHLKGEYKYFVSTWTCKVFLPEYVSVQYGSNGSANCLFYTFDRELGGNDIHLLPCENEEKLKEVLSEYIPKLIEFFKLGYSKDGKDKIWELIEHAIGHDIKLSDELMADYYEDEIKVLKGEMKVLRKQIRVVARLMREYQMELKKIKERQP